MARMISRSSAVSAPLVAFLALIVGLAAVRMPQLAVAAVLLLLLFAIRTESRSAGLMTLWAYWLLLPALRRIIDLMVAAPAADPLSVLPFVATALLALMELRENRLNNRSRTILAFVAAAILIGVPVGLTIDPAATTFAAVAYLAGLSAFVIGWGDETRPKTGSTLERALTFSLLPLALYGIAQYFLPLTSWDANWVDSAALGSIEAPQEDHIRVFSTLNSPFTFAIVLSVGILFGVAMRKRFALGLLTLLPLVVALALTFVRSAWLSLVVGLIVYAGAGKGRAAGRTVGIVIVCLVAVVVVGNSNPTTKAFTDRITSLGDPNSDLSAQERLETTNQLLPESMRQPLGGGLGQAGLAADLNESTESVVVDVDNGYLALLYQSGPFAFLLLLWGIFASVGAAVHVLGRAPPEERPYRAAILAILLMLLVAETSADVLFGLPGVIFWYLAGLSVAAAARETSREEREEQAASEPPQIAINRAGAVSPAIR
jgi:putative inorganic carbon (hco3(-)) transporter